MWRARMSVLPGYIFQNFSAPVEIPPAPLTTTGCRAGCNLSKDNAADLHDFTDWLTTPPFHG